MQAFFRQHTSRQCCRALASDTAALKEAKEAAAGAAHTAQSADDAFAAAQEAVQHLSEERAAAEERLCAAVAHADECTVALASASAECNAAEDNLKVNCAGCCAPVMTCCSTRSTACQVARRGHGYNAGLHCFSRGPRELYWEKSKR